MNALAGLLQAELYGYLLIFCRIGAALMVLPGFGEAFISPRVRLAFALLLTLAIAPSMPMPLPEMPEKLVTLIGPIAGEVIIGLFFGLFARALVAAVETAGMIISFQMSLANAVAFNPALATQGSIIGSFLSITALVLIFASDTHHVIILALADTYLLMPIGQIPPFQDLADAMARVVATSFSIAMRLAAPFILLGLVFNLALGILAR
ncbi:MAG: flagellar biosynthetic protein FliR, partial [Pseudomonadota bacterium]